MGLELLRGRGVVLLELQEEAAHAMPELDLSTVNPHTRKVHRLLKLLKDINVENELEIFHETGVPAHQLGPGVGIDKLIDEGYGLHSLFGLKVQLSPVGSQFVDDRGNLRRGSAGL